MTPDVGSDSPGTPPPGRLGAGGDHRADGAVRGVGRPRLRRRHLRSDPLRVGQHYRHRSSHRRSGQAQRCSSEHRPSSSSRVPHRIRLDRRPRRGGDRSGPPRAPSHRARTGCVESSSSPLTVGPFSSGTPVRPHLPQRPGSRRNVRKKSLIFQAFLRRRYWLGAPLRQMWTLCHPDESGYAAETPQAPSGGRPLTLVPHVSTATRAKGPLLARRGQGVSRVHRHARKGGEGGGGGGSARRQHTNAEPTRWGYSLPLPLSLPPGCWWGCCFGGRGLVERVGWGGVVWGWFWCWGGAPPPYPHRPVRANPRGGPHSRPRLPGR